MSTYTNYSNFLLALCVWREARGCTTLERMGVKHVILNRVAKPAGPYLHCKSIPETILCHAQFSSFNPNDANTIKFPNPFDIEDYRAFAEICNIIDDPTTDPTNGADSYYNSRGVIVPPAWATRNQDKFKVQLGESLFYKLY
jgi:hypothetical protein